MENTRKAQEVTIYGEHIGFQFSLTTNGKRTVKTTVRNIRKGIWGIDEAEHWFGDINWHDRKNVLVVLRLESISWWTTVERSEFNSGC
jgi:protease II